MKRTLLISVLLGISLLIQAQAPYAIKSGYIKYELTGNTNGTEELWWSDYGAKTRTLTKSKTVTNVLGVKSEEKVHKLEIIDKGTAYIVDYIKGENTKMTVPYQPSKKLRSDMTDAERKKVEDDILKSFGGKRLGKETVKGYGCDKIEVMGMTSWIYKGVTLKSSGEVFGVKLSKKFLVFEPNSKVSASKFLPPKGIKFEEPLNNTENNPFALFASEMNKEQEDEETPSDIVPTQYPFETFQEKVNDFMYESYQKMMELNNTGGVHSAMFMKGFSGSLTVIAASRKNSDFTSVVDAKSFTHNGKKCYYKTDNENGESASILLIDIPKYDSYIMISASPKTEKEEILLIADEFDF